MRFWFGIKRVSSQPLCQLLLFLVCLIWRSLMSVQDQVSDGAFFIHEIHVQGLSPWSLPAIWGVRRTWYSPFQVQSWAIFVLIDSRSEVWEKIGNVPLRIVARFWGNQNSGSSPICKFVTETPRQLTGLKKNISIIFLSLQVPSFFIIKLFLCIKLCLVMYISAARIVINHPNSY